MGGVAIVTGCYGFLGRQVVSALKTSGWYVCGVGRPPRIMDDTIEMMRPDHLIAAAISPDSLREALASCPSSPLAIVHAAGNGSVAIAHADPITDFDLSVNSVSTTLSFIRAACPQTRFIFPSSASVYGQAMRTPLQEDAACVPISIYGLHKQVCETLIAGYVRTAGIAATVIRFFSLYGPGLRKQLIWDVCEKAAQAPHQILLDGDGSDVRDFLHVKDAAELIRLAALSTHSGMLTINGGSGIPHSVSDIGIRIAQLYGVDMPTFSAVVRPWDPSFFLADMTRAREKLGFVPSIGLDQGLLEVVNWHKSQALYDLTNNASCQMLRKA